MDFLTGLWCWLAGIEGQTWAGWAQAFGAILAIYITQRIASAETRRLRADNEQAKVESIRTVLTLIFRGEAMLRGGASITPMPFFPPPLPSAAVRHALNVIAGHLEGLQILSNPSPVLVRASLASANEIRKALGVYQAAADGKALATGKLVKCADELRACGEMLMKTYRIEDRASL